MQWDILQETNENAVQAVKSCVFPVILILQILQMKFGWHGDDSEHERCNQLWKNDKTFTSNYPEACFGNQTIAKTLRKIRADMCFLAI